jgi:hypothetical protein
MSACLPARSSVLPSVRMEQRGFYWTDFHEIFRAFFESLSRELSFIKI